MAEDGLKHLKSIFHFTDEELLANTNGHMTEQQRIRLEARYRKFIAEQLWLWYLTILILIFVSLIFYLEKWLIPAIFLGIIQLLLLIRTGMTHHRMWKKGHEDLQKGTVFAITGIVQVSTEQEKGADPLYYVNIADEKFEVSQTEFYGFSNHQKYTIYYTPGTHIILSVEPHFISHSKVIAFENSHPES